MNKIHCTTNPFPQAGISVSLFSVYTRNTLHACCCYSWFWFYTYVSGPNFKDSWNCLSTNLQSIKKTSGPSKTFQRYLSPHRQSLETNAGSRPPNPYAAICANTKRFSAHNRQSFAFLFGRGDFHSVYLSQGVRQRNYCIRVPNQLWYLYPNEVSHAFIAANYLTCLGDDLRHI